MEEDGGRLTEDFLFDSRGKVVYRRSSRNVAFHHHTDVIKAVILFKCVTMFAHILTLVSFFPFLLLDSINLYLCLDFFMFKPVACSMFGNYLWTSVNKERSREAHGQKLYLLNVSDF